MPTFNNPSNKTWLTISDVAELLQIGERTVRRWIAVGELGARQFGRRWRIGPVEMERFLNARSNRMPRGVLQCSVMS